jgi:hypothetical protein
LSTEGTAIVMRQLAITDMAAKVTVDKRIREAGSRVAKLAEDIAVADKQGLQGEPFRNSVGTDARKGEEGSDGRTAAALWADGNRGDQVAERFDFGMICRRMPASLLSAARGKADSLCSP